MRKIRNLGKNSSTCGDTLFGVRPFMPKSFFKRWAAGVIYSRNFSISLKEPFIFENAKSFFPKSFKEAPI